MVNTRYTVLIHRIPEHSMADHLSGMGKLGKDGVSGYYWKRNVSFLSPNIL